MIIAEVIAGILSALCTIMLKNVPIMLGMVNLAVTLLRGVRYGAGRCRKRWTKWCDY